LVILCGSTNGKSFKVIEYELFQVIRWKISSKIGIIYKILSFLIKFWPLLLFIDRLHFIYVVDFFSEVRKASYKLHILVKTLA
jgi:hypothetical protein